MLAPKSLNRRDIVLLTITAVVGIDVVVLLCEVGSAQALMWSIVVAATFVVPYALIVAELGAAFTGDGGPYLWMRLAFGKPVAAVATMFYWMTNPIWLGGSLAFLAEATCATVIGGLSPDSLGGYAFRTAFIWLSIAAATVDLRLGKRIMAAGATTKIVVLVLFVVTIGLYALKHGQTDYVAINFAPTLKGLLATTPILLFALVGLEAPHAAVREMRDPAGDVPRAVAASAAISLACYMIPVCAFAAVVPPGNRETTGDFLAAQRQLVGVYGGAASTVLAATALLFAIALLSQGGAWMITANRMQAAAAADGAFPRQFGALSSRSGTPVPVNLLAGVVATVFSIAAAELRAGGATIFKIVLTTAMSTLLLSYLVIVPSIVRLRRRHPDVPRPYRVPGGRFQLGATVAVVWCWVAFGGWLTVFPGTLEALIGVPYDFAGDWGVSRVEFEVFTVGTLLTIIATALSGYCYAKRQQRIAHVASASSGFEL